MEYIGYNVYQGLNTWYIILCHYKAKETGFWYKASTGRVKPTRLFRTREECEKYLKKYFKHLMIKHEWGYVGEIHNHSGDIPPYVMMVRPYVPTYLRRGYWGLS